MSTHRGRPTDEDRPGSGQSIRRFSVLIALFWLGLAVVTNVFVPQLETVAEAHNVSLSPQDAPSLQASKQIGKVFSEFDSDSAAMIVLEGDQPLGADAHHYYDGLVKKLSAGHQARPAHSGFLGRSADGGRLAEHRRQGGVGAGVSRRQPGHVAGQRVRRLHPQHREPAHRRRRGSRPTSPAPRPWSPISSRWAAQGTLKTTLITIGVIMVMLFVALPPSHHGDPGPLHGDDRVDRVPRRRRRAGERRHHRAVDVLDQSADVAGDRGRNGLRDLHPGPFPRSAPHRAGSGDGVRNDVPGHRAHHLGFGPDDRRRGVLSELHPAPILQQPGRSRWDRRPRRGGGGADPGTGAAESSAAISGCSSPAAPDAHPGLATHRDGHRALARTHPGGDDRRGPHRSARAAGIQDELRRPPLHARQCPGQRRLRGGRAALLPGPAQSRIADDRGRPRSAQSHRHDPARAGGQGRLPHRRNRPGPVDHATVGHAPGPHVDSVPDQRGELVADQQPALPASPHRRPAQAGRRHRRHGRRAAAAICAATTVQ